MVNAPRLGAEINLALVGSQAKKSCGKWDRINKGVTLAHASD